MKKCIGMFAVAALASILLTAWPGNAANAQAYWGYGVNSEDAYEEHRAIYYAVRLGS